MDHIRRVLTDHSPRIVLAFGAIARDAVASIRLRSWTLLTAPHPAARGVNVMAELRRLRQALDDRLS